MGNELLQLRPTLYIFALQKHNNSYILFGLQKQVIVFPIYKQLQACGSYMSFLKLEYLNREPISAIVWLITHFKYELEAD